MDGDGEENGGLIVVLYTMGVWLLGLATGVIVMWCWG